MKPIDGQKLRFVLSGGRAGTTFLREFLKARGGPVDVAFEPPTSRRCWILWNMEQAGLAPRGVACVWAMRRRARDAQAVPDGHVRVEINPFLSPFVAELCQRTESLHAVHIVRHPFTWIRSMGNFKAAYWRRHVIDLVPFTQQVHPEARARWGSLPPVLRLAWRWRQANEGIDVAREGAHRYVRFRYEDLLSSSREQQGALLEELLDVIDPSGVGAGTPPAWEERLNADPGGEIPEWTAWSSQLRAEVLAVCAPLMEAYGYGERP